VLPQYFLPSNYDRIFDLHSTKGQTVTKMEEVSPSREPREREKAEETAANLEEVEDFQLLNQQYLECRKAEFLFNNVVLPVEERLLDRKNQQHVEMLYLMVARCKASISHSLQAVKEHYDEEISELFGKQVSNLEERIRLKH
jgi:hypothetical protein